ncbi:MAG: sulfite exporter TauE/SafE family protein [Thermincola sp.]|nr:sulfite exporter TauE/SafE family protein [Thermincola sp.]MDT3701456.1 sulfite exporter TauE/SafE family protein [Thermincola sp.]
MLVTIIGFLAGILSGLAVGGGTLLVPALVILSDLSQHMAQGVTLLSFIPTSMVAVYTHYKSGNVRPRLAFYLTFGTVAGAVAGAIIAGKIPAAQLKQFFGVFLMIMGIYEFCCKRHH